MAKIKLKNKTIWLVAVLTVFLAVWPTDPAVAGSITKEQVINLVNQARAVSNLPVLRENSLLDQAAKAKAEDMLKNDYFAHTSPSGVDPWHWFSKVGYNYKYAGENLAINFTDAERQQAAWMKSETHRKNILNQSYREIGVAVTNGKIDGEETTLTVQLFGTPMAFVTEQQPAAQPEPERAGEILPAETENLIPENTQPNPEPVSVPSAPLFEPAQPIAQADSFDISWWGLLAIVYLAIIANPVILVSKAIHVIWSHWQKPQETPETDSASLEENQQIAKDFQQKMPQAEPKHIIGVHSG